MNKMATLEPTTEVAQKTVMSILLPPSATPEAPLEVRKGARISKTFTAAYVSVPTAADHLAGDGWKLTLKSGWRVVPGEKPGYFKIAPK